MTGGSPPSGEESVLARTAGFAAAKGAGVIAVAVLVGVLLLQVVDHGSTGPVGTTGDDKPSATTTTEKPSADKTTTTTADVVQEKTPDQVRVLVLNGGAIAGAAGTMSTSLTEKGYTNQEPANDDSTTRTGNVVHCREGLEREAAALAVAVGEGTTVEDFPDPAPPHSDGVDCVVVVGS